MTIMTRTRQALSISAAIILLGLFCTNAIAQTAQTGSKSSVLADTNLFGQDYRSFDVETVFRCRNACLEEQECKAWTFVKRGVQGDSAVCWLKDSVPAEAKNDCCTSGIKTTSNEQRDSGERSAETARGPHLRISGMEITLSRRVTASHIPTDPTLTFDERDRTVLLAFRNTSGRYLRAVVDVYPEAVQGFNSREPYWRGAWASMGPGQRNSIRLDGPKTGLLPGRYRVVVRVDGNTKFARMEVTSEHPLAQILDPAREAKLGPNIALAALGGTATTSSNWENYDIAGELIDGVPWIRNSENTRECMKCGWASRVGDASPSATLDLAGDRPVAISAVVIDVRKFKPEWTNWNPKTLRISVSETGNEADFRPVTTARLSEVRERQLIELPETVMARAVRFDFLSNFDREPGAGINEIEVREAPGANPSLLAELELDIARPELGGAVVRYRGFGERWTAARLFDGPPTAWSSSDDYFPQDFTIAFNRDRRASIDRVELIMDDEEEYSDQWPSEVAVALSDHPIEGFEEVARRSIERRGGVYEIPIGATARFVKVRLLDNHGAPVTNLGEIRIIEARDAPSVLASEGARDAAGAGQYEDINILSDLQESEPNESADEANDLVFDQTLEGRIDPLGEQDFFALPDIDPEATALSLAYSGRPYIRHGLSLLDEAGKVLSQFDPGDFPAADARLSFKLAGSERYLRLTEPPASVVVIWDTSGSMQGSEGDLERAVRQYVRLAPESQLIRMIRFSNDVEVLGPAFSSAKSVLYSYLGGKFIPKGGTSLYDAVLRGLEMLEDRTGNRAIVLMTDGNDKSRTWLGDVWAELERNRVRLYTIGLGDGLEEYSYVLASTGERLLGHLAAGTDGRSFFATESSALSDFYGQIAAELSAPATYLLKPSQEIGAGLLQVVAIGEQVPSAALPAVHVIFDVSGSMSEGLPGGGRRIDAAKQAMFTTLESLPDGAPFGLTVYGARIPERPDKALACTDIVTVQDLAPLDKAPVGRFIRDLRPRGGTTPLASSIAHVVENFGAKDGGIIVAITDGIEECDPEPLVTVEDLKVRGLEQIELNVIGFDLRDAASSEMMQQIAGIGGGTYFDASDGDAVAAALKSAIAASYRVLDAAGTVAASGKIDGEPQSMPPGWYTVEIAAADGARRMTEVRVDADKLTTLEVNKVGSEMDLAVEQPRTFDPLVECGRPAERLGDADRTIRIQQKLNENGHDVGTPDGQIGPNTRRGIEAFAEAHGLELETEATLLLEQHLDCVASNGIPYGG